MISSENLASAINEAEAIATPLADVAALSGNPVAVAVDTALSTADTVTKAGEAAASEQKSTGVSVASAVLTAASTAPELQGHPNQSAIIKALAEFFGSIEHMF